MLQTWLRHARAIRDREAPANDIWTNRQPKQTALDQSILLAWRHSIYLQTWTFQSPVVHVCMKCSTLRDACITWLNTQFAHCALGLPRCRLPWIESGVGESALSVDLRNLWSAWSELIVSYRIICCFNNCKFKRIEFDWTAASWFVSRMIFECCL